ncbi:ABC transporter permease [Spirochaetia bacterium]|nr:ABC transporter permease [Spirochaetia bacterium]
MKDFLPVLRGATMIMTPLLFAATGGLFCELAGMLNIALEGLLLAGAFSAVAAFYYTGSLTAALAAAVMVSVFLAFILAFTTLTLRSNVFITGLAANLLASGGAIVLSHYLFDTRGVVALRDIPYLPGIAGYSIYMYASWLLVIISALVIYKTPFGYRLRACGKHAEALSSLGLRPDVYRLAAFLISGFCCGIGGSFLSLNLGAFVPNMSAGKGWIALVVIFLGGRKPQGLVIAAFVFGLAEAFSNYAQGQLNVPADFILAIPYIFTLLVMIAVSAAKPPIFG